MHVAHLYLPCMLIVPLLLCNIVFSNILGNDDFCRYKFNFFPLPWMDAQKVCESKNRTLVKLEDASEYSLLASMAGNTIAPRVSATEIMSSQLWVGLRAQSAFGTIQHQWEDCDHLASTSAGGFNPWQNTNDETMEGCIALNTNLIKYDVQDCNSARPFVCEVSSAVPCYVDVDWENEQVFNGFSDHINLGATDLTECKDDCLLDGHCIAFQFVDPGCSLLKYAVGPPTGLNARNPAYTMGFIDHTSYPAVGASVPPPQSLCSNYVSPSPSISSSSSSSSIIEESTYLSSESTSILSSFSSSTTPYLSSVSSEITSSPLDSESSTPVFSSGGVVTTQSVCYCPCSQYTNKTYTPEEIQSKIEKIKKELTINVKETNTYQRSLISAPDERVSAKSIGYVGVAILAVVCTLLILVDLPRCIVGCKNFCSSCR